MVLWKRTKTGTHEFLGFHNEGLWIWSSGWDTAQGSYWYGSLQSCYTAQGSHWNGMVFRSRLSAGFTLSWYMWAWDWGAGNGNGKRDKEKSRKTGMIKHKTWETKNKMKIFKAPIHPPCPPRMSGMTIGYCYYIKVLTFQPRRLRWHHPLKHISLQDNMLIQMFNTIVWK